MQAVWFSTVQNKSITIIIPVNLMAKKGNDQLQDCKNYSYVFVMVGVVEVEHRLLHHKDGEAINFEALSGGAILLLFELSLHTNKIAV